MTAESVATAKAERLLNLVIALVNSPRYRTAAWIREKVAGYADAPTERGVLPHVRAGQAGAARARHPRADAAGRRRRLPHPADRVRAAGAVLHPRRGRGARAGRPALGDHGAGARRLRGAAQDPGRAGPRPEAHAAPAMARPDAPAKAAAGSCCCSHGCARPIPPLRRLLAAVRARRAVTFDYRKDPRGGARAAGGCSPGAWCLITGAGTSSGTIEARQRPADVSGVPDRRPRARRRSGGRGVAARRRRPAGRGGGKRPAGRRPHGDAARPRRVMPPGCAGRRSRRCPTTTLRSGTG